MLKYFLCFILAVNLYADDPKPQLKPSPTIGDYEKTITFYKKTTTEVFDLKTWKGVELTNKTTKEKTSFDKLSDFDKHIFCASIGKRLMTEMGLLNNFWKEEVEKIKDPNYKAVPLEKVEKPEQKAAEIKDIEKFQKDLLELRQSFAQEFEKYLIKVFTDFKDDIPEKERELHLKQVQEYHDKEKLIERKK